MIDLIEYPVDPDSMGSLLREYRGDEISLKVSVLQLFLVLTAATDAELHVWLEHVRFDSLYLGLHPECPVYVGDQLAKRVSSRIVGSPVLTARGFHMVRGLARYHTRPERPA